ncbi:MFS transporter [Sansalvadorimonas sp. 2012CJ34-2]|uniref:MFS transporter n=1 Tax=Parendozoicomonas callyspongiae TaxID=2942213 RepID=A0ABT0PIH8_9GAMM|nr:MFS transporter [Sansalvadorimonas sp. 2012CJ34-2]MCL6271056.1 MFS transporter [Sansalvadorimonas sp. 2012CJ34-2]
MSSSVTIKQQHKLLFITAAGGALEFYDFTLFMLFASHIRSAFFPEAGLVTGLSGVMLLFFAGYLARPLGGLVFSYFGDRFGRRNQFLITLSLMSCSTLAIGLIPDYGSIGPAAVIMVMISRILQGASVGGEIPGSVVYLAEWLPYRCRGRYISIIITAITSGNLAGSLTGYILTLSLSESQISEWGWRLPFILGFALGMVLLLARRQMQETPPFLDLVQANGVLQNPFLTLMKQQPFRVVQGICLASVPACMVSFFLYAPVWLGQHLKWSAASSFSLSTLAFLTICSQVPFYGWLSDQIGRKRLNMTGALLLLPGLWLFSQIISSEAAPYTSLILLLITTIPLSMVLASYETIIVELYPTTTRFTGLGLSHNIGFTIFGGLFPLTAEYLIEGGCIMAPLILAGGCAILNSLAAYQLPFNMKPVAQP